MATLLNPIEHFGLAHILQGSASLGVLAYVNEAANGGDDANDGLAPGRPKLTIAGAAGAISLCTDDEDILDTIVVQGIPAETYPITIDRARVSVVDAGAPGWFPRLRLDARSAVEDVFVIESNYAYVRGFELRAGANKSGVAIAAADVHRCRFSGVYFGYGDQGVLFSNGGGGHQVDHSYFNGPLQAYGVRVATNSYQLRINDNVFNVMVGAIGVGITGGPGDGQLLDNTFGLSEDVVGGAITLDVALDWIVAGNRANDGQATMTQNPYRDLSTRNMWMQNWQGNALTDAGVA